MEYHCQIQTSEGFGILIEFPHSSMEEEFQRDKIGGGARSYDLLQQC